TNDTAFFRRIPLIHGAIHRFEGQMTVFAPHLGGPCYRCLLPSLPAPGTVPSCAEAGVIGALPGIVGSLQAMEALKCIAQMGRPAIGKLICYDALLSTFRSLTLRPDPDCRLCGGQPSIFDIANPETIQAPTCAMNPLPVITARDLHHRLNTPSDIILIDVREPEEHAQAAIPGSLLIPLGSLPSRLAEISSMAPIVVHCKAGGRSAKAAHLLFAHGFTDVSNLTGGIDAWLAENLPTVP
ncbi:MAG: ThiF family adenylyltransferase, partial [Verrucomicrobia bacterium]|nr:ThiF family adenylyltransferase [Verrucomicrobiota bacterium]